ncbi:MAG: Stp1/IreP family PP2C-type Ser/Thr phosphatase [Oscillospiraceae bacterium]|nr:Stp1/IreP family PP2C-type Ser/Thr phosphatase [Oscillospiraceae bacterium]
MKSFGLTDKGKIRKDNQDCFIIEQCEPDKSLVLALCDGMGGENAGEIASSLSNKAFVSYVYGKLNARVQRRTDYQRLLLQACSEANGVAFEYSRFDEAYSGMGTTLVGGVVKADGSAYLINVGDSRAYLISPRRRVIEQITRDHSLVEEMVESGLLTKEEARCHPQKNVITRALGSEADVQADFFRFRMKSGDLLLLCSDGLSNTVGDKELLEYAAACSDPEGLCHSLMDCALERGARDNVTVVVVSK